MRVFLLLSFFIIYSQYSLAQKQVKSTHIDSAKFYIEANEFAKALPFLDEKIGKNSTAELYLTRALAKIELSDLEGALSDLRTSLSLQHDNDTVFYNIGYVLYLQGEYAESVNYFDSALLMRPDSPFYLTARGDSFLELDNYNLAMEDYRNVISIEKEADLGYYGIALCHYYTENYDSARYYLSIAISLDPFDADYFYQRGLCKYILDDNDGALEDLVRAADNDPEFIPPKQLLAEIYADNALYEIALKYLDAALEIDSSDLNMLSDRGRILLSTDRYQEALNDFNAIINAGIQTDAVYYNRGMAHYHLGNYGDAEKDFEMAVSLNRTDEDYFIFRALSRLALGQTESSFQDFSSAITINPGNPDIYFYRSQAFYDLGRYEDALHDLDTVFYIEPEYPGIFLARAESYAALGITEEALKNYDLAIILDPDNGENFFKRGLFLYDNNNYNGALEDFDFAIELDGTISSPYVNRGLVKLELKDKTGACQDWKKAFQLGSEYARELLKKHCQHTAQSK